MHTAHEHKHACAAIGASTLKATEGCGVRTAICVVRVVCRCKRIAVAMGMLIPAACIRTHVTYVKHDACQTLVRCGNVYLFVVTVLGKDEIIRVGLGP